MWLPFSDAPFTCTYCAERTIVENGKMAGQPCCCVLPIEADIAGSFSLPLVNVTLMGVDHPRPGRCNHPAGAKCSMPGILPTGSPRWIVIRPFIEQSPCTLDTDTDAGVNAQNTRLCRSALEPPMKFLTASVYQAEESVYWLPLHRRM